MANSEQPGDQIGYHVLQQEALRGVVRAALKHAAAKGLPGDHHFYISFRTQAPGVSGPKELLDQYPDEMMIVLQHQYWDLAPGETFFSVTLRFGGQPKALSIPYAAITEFRDPSVNYRLVFTPMDTPPPAVQVAAASGAADGPNIVSLDQFRKK
ncbi:MAG TPA: ClpXP protease specificity-enhancing factor SspB [Caulobacteraceae bacterium]|nr:ClpXP protease specificity-enhancing factor SspB [Caulobacteraceae bacterium]